MGKRMDDTPHVVRSASSWMVSEAEEQLRRVPQLDGMTRVVGMPDLHPGKGSPIGAAYFSETRIFPPLVGGDVGCGMGLWQTEVTRRRVKKDKWERRLRSGDLEMPWSGDAAHWLAQHGACACGHERSLGTVGRGNHFAELLEVVHVEDATAFAAAGLRADRVQLLVHSGSRGLGRDLLDAHLSQFGEARLEGEGPEGQAYLARHDAAVVWAKANRALLAERLDEALGLRPSLVLDVVHNSVTRARWGGVEGFLHRKGAAPADAPLVVVPGSRGTHSYLVAPRGDGEVNGHSLAHGAGRKWTRSEARGKLERRFSRSSLRRTALGGRVVCDDTALLYEEAPQAYKAIETVVEAMVEAGVAQVVAVLAPLLTYKVVRS